MRYRVPASRSRIPGQIAVAAILAAAVAGCSSTNRTPLFTGSTENQRQIIGNSQPMPSAVSDSAVARSDLPPPGQAGAQSGAHNTAGLAPGSYEWTPAGVKPSGAATTTISAAPAAGASHVVGSGETVYSIGRLYGVSPNSIVAANNLAQPQNIRAGQRLTIPGAAAPKVASAPPPQVTAPQVAMVQPTPSASSAAKPAVAKSAPRVIAGVPSIPVEAKSNTPPAIPASTTAAAVDEVVEPPSADGTSFRWPVRGRIISGFGSKPSGQRNDGINLAVPEGTSVKAAEAGTVIYAGNELEGYGNLVLVRHADEWVSAYAHNSEIKVKKGDTIRRGQTIATAGMSGSVTSPQLHFELRKKAKPVNPLDYLAGV
jgi:murein DD-endopeptidase MepM/ murein hydrolase activator NlpD